MSRIVLFGGSGFIGSAIRTGMRGNVIAPGRDEVNLTDGVRLRGLLRSGDVVVNAAGYAAATDRSAAGLGRLRRENVEAVETLAREAALAGVAQLIHISSVAAMGYREGRGLRESDMREPRSPYARSKLDAELALANATENLPITILRPTSVFGEGRGLAAMLCRMAALPWVPLPASGRALIPFTYVANVAEAVRLSIGNPACLGRTFIVGDEDSYPLREILAALAGALGKKALRTLPVGEGMLRTLSRVESWAQPLRRGPALLDETRIGTLTRSISFSIDAFTESTGYVPLVTMPEAAGRIARWHLSGGAR